MLRRLSKVTLVFGAGFFAMTLSVSLAADEPKPTDWSAWTTVGVWSGEVSKLGKGNKSFRMKKSNGTTPATGKPTPGKKAEIVELEFVDGALIRWAKLPPKLDTEGKEVKRTADELAELKLPTWAKGYAATIADLKPGTLVEVTLVRPKELQAKEVQFSDYRVKMVLMTGENPTPPKNKKKNN